MAKKAEFSIETVKKYIFWAVMPVSIIVAVTVTFMAVGAVGKAFNEKKSALESQKQAVEKIRGEALHPNEETIKEIENCTKELRGRVQKAWITLEKDQKLRNKWPAAPGPEFVAEVEKLKFGDEITIDSREHYLNFVEKYLPQLEYGVDRRRVQYLENKEWKEIDPMKERASGAGTGSDAAFGVLNARGMSTMDGTSSSGSTLGMSGGNSAQNYQPKVNEDGEEIERMVGVVDWSSPETRTVTASWERLPKSNEVWFAQEELWVYAALLSVVKKSNAGATGPHNAAVKRIENLLIGQAAAMPFSVQLKRRPGRNASGSEGMSMDSSMSGGGPGMSGSGGESSGMGTGMMVAKTEEDVVKMKKQFRYIDDKGEPLAADSAAPFAQFNRMPVFLRLVVDQRKIPEIMVNCANCDMPIDVLRIIINPGGSRPLELSEYEAAAGAAAGGSDSSGMGSSSDMGSGAGYGGGGGSSPSRGTSGKEDVQVKLDGVGGMYGSNAVPIEIYGRISIFNPVESSLTVPAETPAESTENAAADNAASAAETSAGAEPAEAAPTM